MNVSEARTNAISTERSAVDYEKQHIGDYVNIIAFCLDLS